MSIAPIGVTPSEPLGCKLFPGPLCATLHFFSHLEIHVLWAQHQVHHTSEDFNMGVGIRQSILQGWCGFIFYLPLALVIPPAQFVMHHQFSYLYMFWIHTDTIKTLGPLEYVLNTPSHHRIHHGSNPYCIDVNYGGVLIIWDKIFRTFRPEMKGDRIVYGLIYQQPSFNPLHLQGMSPISVLILVLYILGSLTVFGMILDASPKAPILEMARCVIMIFIARWISPSWGVVISPPLQLFYILSALFWSLFVYKTVEIRAVKSSD
ncbi:alkylglycerol monooxygenase-like isoform X4 [Hyposmocoma kahamanoa]|uniref:alkylglycerol monooxygenase-like isoform X4 n=1 Tax=Hyposmocoma kahamanoa TaxID=1477025 RepID=UPI000E6D728B|nr:alkylglycerol monooxygenase-like isoform X4 [Hyposmocoma kahamanoa]